MEQLQGTSSLNDSVSHFGRSIESIETQNLCEPPDVETTEETDEEDIDDVHKTLKKLLLSLRKKPSTECDEEIPLPTLKCTTIENDSRLIKMLKRDKNTDYLMKNTELDYVQWDFESMLSSIIERKNTITEERRTYELKTQFAHIQQKTETKSKCFSMKPRIAAVVSPADEYRKLKNKWDLSTKELLPCEVESAEKFWSMVEPFHACLESEDCSWVDNLVKSYRANKKLYYIPSMGNHFGVCWALEELTIQESNQASSPPPNKLLSERLPPNVIEILNKLNMILNEENIYLPVYKHMLSSIHDFSNLSPKEVDNFFAELDANEDLQELNAAQEELRIEPSVETQSNKLKLVNHYAEQTYRPVMLPAAFVKPDNDFDEVLNELRGCSSLLIKTRDSNEDYLSKLLKKCLLDCSQKKIMNQLDVVNSKILQLKRPQNDTLTEEEQLSQDLRLLLDERRRYIKQMKSMGCVSHITESIYDLESEGEEMECDKQDEVGDVKNCGTEKNNKIKYISTNVDVRQQDSIKRKSVDTMQLQFCKIPKQNTSNNELIPEIELEKSKFECASKSNTKLDTFKDKIRGVKRSFSSLKLNEGVIYFEPYDGSTSEESDSTDSFN